jgi:NAD(P)-dependent dehydrogenase (short-subunit alcohol dehydrogenase family)
MVNPPASERIYDFLSPHPASSSVMLFATDRSGAPSPGIVALPTAGRSLCSRGRRTTTRGPVGQIGEISDIVDGILYLERATFVTGEILHIDGGQAAGH